jgi:hypothetical protein
LILCFRKEPIFLTCLLCILASRQARAQYVQSLFPTGVPGYNEEGGVTVLSRLRSSYDAEPIRLGDYDIRPEIDETGSYDSNVQGGSGASGSSVAVSQASVSLDSDWARNSLGANVSVADTLYGNLPVDNHVDWTAAIGGSYTLGQGDITAGYAHLAEHELGTQFGALQTSNAVPYSVDDYRASMTTLAGRFSFTPNLDVQTYRFGTAVLGGRRVDEAYDDRTLIEGGVTTRFDLGGDRGVVLVLQGDQTRYPNTLRGDVNEGSSGFIALGGIDYQATGVFRYRLLVGVETRAFTARAYGSQTAPITEASVIWTPTPLTTITDTITREIESPASADAGDFTYLSDTLTVDHELTRNILLQGKATVQQAEYLSQGSQNSLSLGLSATWLISKTLRVIASYNYAVVSSPPAVSATGTGTPIPLSGGYTTNVINVTLRVTL